MKRQNNFAGMFTPVIALLLALGATGARADIVTYDNGKVVKGIIEAGAANAEVISFQTDSGTLSIPRARVREIKRESKAQGYIHIGNQRMAKQNYPAAIQAFQQAVDLEPGNQAALQALNEAQAKVNEQEKLNRGEAIAKIDKLGAEAKRLMENKDFAEAEKLLKKANDLVPSPEQRARLASLISNLYLAWSKDRQDKLDMVGAEEKLNLALAADRGNETAAAEILKLWEKDPQKRKQTTSIYETMLDRHPEDRELRKKLGDLYYQMGQTEDATRHYLDLYHKSDQYKGTQLEERLVELLDKLQKQYAREKDYDKAIQYFQIMAAINPKADPTDVIFYQFAKRAQSLKPDDWKGRFQLALFAEQNGMDEQALNLYKQLLKNNTTKAQAQAAIDRYAEQAFKYAQSEYQAGNYILAGTLADQVRNEYPTSTRIVTKADELIAKAHAEQVRDSRMKREQAKDLVERGTMYYQQAKSNFNAIFSTERRELPQLTTFRTEARRYFLLAINSFQQALNIDPSLAKDPTAPVNVYLGESRALLARLNRAPSLLPRNYGAPLPQGEVN